MSSMIIARAAARMATPAARLGQTSSFSTARVLRNTVDSSAAATSSRGGITGLFPRRMGWGGALVLFHLGVADGVLSTVWYMSRDKAQ
ncbi:hypothetical protein Sste5346_009100 [Sporothrix stenoceras]|uniref:Uncharacterized protein n=1 Tax=Sporothrix stenoceras TaxID=5173 RepID=A0ABR3YMW1_9PEZI